MISFSHDDVIRNYNNNNNQSMTVAGGGGNSPPPSENHHHHHHNHHHNHHNHHHNHHNHHQHHALAVAAAAVTEGANQSLKMSDYNRSLLETLNDEMVRTLLPAILYLVVLMVVGSVGNFLTILIYGWRLKPTTQNCLFMWLGVVDIMSCLVGMPSEIVDLRYYFLYEHVTACKILRFLLTFPPCASANLLLVIAVDRYRRVCKPLHSQMELHHARAGVALSALVAVVLAGPAVSIYGKRSVPTSVPGLTGCDCSVEDEYQGHLYPLLYELLFGVLFLLYTAILSVLYGRVWMETRRHHRYMASHSIPALPYYTSLLNLSNNATGCGGGGQEAALRMTTPATAPASPVSPFASAAGSPASSRKSSGGGGGMLRNTDIVLKVRASLRANKMTVIAFTVTLVFVLSYLPHLVLILLRTTIPDFDQQQTGARLVFFNIFLRSYFVNSVANVFVYSAKNDDFRHQCRKLFALRRAACPKPRSSCHRQSSLEASEERV